MTLWDKMERLLPWLLMFGFLAFQDYRREADAREVRTLIAGMSGDLTTVQALSFELTTIRELMMTQGYTVPPILNQGGSQ